MDRERHQTVAQSQSGGVSGLSRVWAGGMEGEGGECVCVCGGGRVCVWGGGGGGGVLGVHCFSTARLSFSTTTHLLDLTCVMASSPLIL